MDYVLVYQGTPILKGDLIYVNEGKARAVANGYDERDLEIRHERVDDVVQMLPMEQQRIEA